MFDTYVTVVGNVLHQPEQRRIASTGAQVTTFKIASTARRLDRQTGKWIDGNSLRVRITCWRALGINVKQSVQVGDPLIVHGRLFTRDWTDDEGNKRLSYELEAFAVGHDLTRGRAVFERVRPRTTTSTTEDSETEQRVSGQVSEPVPDGETVPFDDTPFEAVFDQPAAAAEDAAPQPAGSVPDAAQGTPLGGDGEMESGSAGASSRRRGQRRAEVSA